MKPNKKPNVVSSRSRSDQKKEHEAKELRRQQDATDKMLSAVKQLEGILGETMQLEIEPNVNTINNIINKKDKKKLN
jgi:hypothetical protein